jgi:hypothetical protein
MKRISVFLVASLILIASILPSQAMTEKRAAAILSTSYIASSSTTCDDDQITVEVNVSGTGEAVIASLKPQWSSDGTNWVDEPVNVMGTASATEQPYTRLSKVFQFSVSATGLAFSETFNRWGNNRYFRIVIKGASATTTALVQVQTDTSKFVR